jgi:predicted CXXCH cytochrome family protein
MDRPAPTVFAQPIHRLVVAIVALILGFVLSLTFLWGQPQSPRPLLPARNGFSLFGNYQSPDRCRECHPEPYAEWAGTVHAQASFDPIFQVYLEASGRPGECFACHATGYDTATGQFALAGVSCEACHGPYRPGHPEATMVIAASETLCGACHTSTLHEWKSSRHGQVGVRCGDCHEVHSQQMRAAVVTNDLCAQCHEAIAGDAVHRRHMDIGLGCVDCHLSRPPDKAESAISGRALTGHAFVATESVCKRCHESIPPAR